MAQQQAGTQANVETSEYTASKQGSTRRWDPAKTVMGLWSARPSMSGLALVIVTNIWLLAAFSTSFWQQAYALFGARPPLLILFGIGIWSFTMSYVLVFTNRWFLKPFLIANILIAAGASYYHETMGIIIDREMIQNIVTTTANESKGLITIAYIKYMLVFALFPSVMILMVRVSHPPFLKSAVRHISLLVLCILAFSGIALGNYQVFSFGIKQSPGMREILHPQSTVQSLLQYAEMTWRAQNMVFQKIALDAHKGDVARRAVHPVLTILVIGETLRDQNWPSVIFCRSRAFKAAEHPLPCPFPACFQSWGAASLPMRPLALRKISWTSLRVRDTISNGGTRTQATWAWPSA